MPGRGGKKAPRGGNRGATRGGKGGRGGRGGAVNKKANLYRDHGYPFYGKFLKVADILPRQGYQLTIPVDEATKQAVRALQAEGQKRLKILSDLRGFDPVPVDHNYGVFLLGFDQDVKGYGAGGKELAAAASKAFSEAFGADEAGLEYGQLSCFDDHKNNKLLLLEIKPTAQLETFLNSLYEPFLSAQGIQFPSAYSHTPLEIIDRPESRTSLITKRLFLPVFQTSINQDREGFVIKALRGLKLGTPGIVKLSANIFDRSDGNQSVPVANHTEVLEEEDDQARAATPPPQEQDDDQEGGDNWGPDA